MVAIRSALPEDVPACLALARLATGTRWSAPAVEAARDRGELLVAHRDGDVVGALGYRTDWFTATLVTFIGVRPDWQRRGVARALYQAMEERSPHPRLFSSAPETNSEAIQMHRALGFVTSGYVDNLPQGVRELLFYKRLTPIA